MDFFDREKFCILKKPQHKTELRSTSLFRTLRACLSFCIAPIGAQPSQDKRSPRILRSESRSCAASAVPLSGKRRLFATFSPPKKLKRLF
jgi:hypothetical protein